jgi:hypothetical protein
MTEGTGEPIHPSLAIPKHGSEESLGRLFERLEAEPDTFKAWGNRARALVDSEHSLEHWAGRLRDVILAAPAQNRLQRRARVLDGLSTDLTHWAPSLGWHTESTQIP